MKLSTKPSGLQALLSQLLLRNYMRVSVSLSLLKYF